MTSDKSGPVRTASPELDEDLDDTRVRKDVNREPTPAETSETKQAGAGSDAPETSDTEAASGGSSKDGAAPEPVAVVTPPAPPAPTGARPAKPAGAATSDQATPSPATPAEAKPAPGAAPAAASAPKQSGSAVPTTGGIWRSAYEAGRSDKDQEPAEESATSQAAPRDASTEAKSWNRVTAPDVPPAPPAPADGSEGVRAGAMKAAQAALDAARSAAKKVSSIGSDEEERTSAAPSTANARPEMHYTAAGVRGTATPAPAGATGGPRPASVPTPEVSRPAPAGPRRVRLAISRVDPWSVMKLAFLLAVAIAIMTVVATAVFWSVLDGFGVFTTVQSFVEDAVGPQSNVNLTQFVEFPRVISLATLISICNIVLLTAIATIMAFLYNITAALVGGVHLTLTDD
ncbi:DUF3566 domain-containing protein [Promicromonospora thailandica]|uniref:DUF3566 domain-containing protein n=1 Tax=Promicromonospora thailandica TaxID=765201 RepID=A0A9X2JVM0_9MICO|nr:DUF3566 domain-containing protein [Promicromonospora thailandica]MCP2265216.1 Transmembrane protein of unknown function (DUF3566) [Promicromonospora thailandica]BFF19702.1 hypothetical protein GCM10025730_32230 [Promicromonospora thailandica]